MRTSLLYFALFFAFAFSAFAEPPVTLDCTIRYWNSAWKKEMEHDYQTGYSTTKVAPKDIAWLRPGENPGYGRTWGFVVVGRCQKGEFNRQHRPSKAYVISFSSARTTKRFPSSRCVSATKIVRPLGSTPARQPNSTRRC